MKNSSPKIKKSPMDKETKKKKYSELDYYKPIDVGFGTLSCDSVRMTGELHKTSLHLLNCFTSSPRPDVTVYPPRSKKGTYRTLCTIEYAPDYTATIGIGLNATGTREDEYKCMFDFNPNKLAQFDQFWTDLGIFKAACGCLEFSRVDIALDIPIPRERVLMMKDKRKYALEMYDVKNKTEYLGRRSNPGYVKVYNKQIEAELDKPMTRIEVTTEFDALKYQCYFPEIYLAADTQLGFDDTARLSRGSSAVTARLAARLIALGENPLPELYGIHEDTKKRIIDLLPVNPLRAVPLSRVSELFAMLKDTLL